MAHPVIVPPLANGKASLDPLRSVQFQALLYWVLFYVSDHYNYPKFRPWLHVICLLLRLYRDDVLVVQYYTIGIFPITY